MTSTPMTKTQPMILDEGFDAKVSRPIARTLAKGLHRAGYSANQVSGLAAAFGVSAALAMVGSGFWPILGAFLLVGMVIIDCTDGEVARLSPPSDKPWAGRMLDGLADLVTVLSTHIAMAVVLVREGITLNGYRLGAIEITILTIAAFASFGWKSSVLDDIKQRLKPNSVDQNLDQYEDQEKTRFEAFLFWMLRRYIQNAQQVTGEGRPGGYLTFRQVALVGPTHQLVAIAVAAAFSPFMPGIFLSYFFLTIVPGNLFLFAVLNRARAKS